jgi:glycolate oxidase iron-sulfur subunit
MVNFRKKKMKMASLIQSMKRLDQQVARCSRCGICQSVCPLYGITHNESDVARGKLMLLDGLMRSFFEDPEGVRQRLDRCLLCGSCAANCPRGVNVVEIFLNARVIMAGYRSMPLIKRVIFRKILSSPKFFDRVVAVAAKWQNIFFRKITVPPAVSCGAALSLPFSSRHLVPLAPVSFHEMRKVLPVEKNKIAKKPEKPLKVAFFVGCLLDKVYPEVAVAIAKILKHHQVDVLVPPAQGCCGIPALASGDQITFNRLVAQNLPLFDPSTYDYLITGCATCTATIKKTWPAMAGSFSDKQHTAIHQISEKTYDIHQFLVDVIGVVPVFVPSERGLKPIVTWHDPCHLKKTLNIAAAPRRLVQANEAYTFVEMPDADACCGMGGSFNLMHYGLSTDIGRKKTASIEKTGASVVATGCPACMIQLSDMLAKAGKNIRVAHGVELYAEKWLTSQTTSE